MGPAKTPGQVSQSKIPKDKILGRALKDNTRACKTLGLDPKTIQHRKPHVGKALRQAHKGSRPGVNIQTKRFPGLLVPIWKQRGITNLGFPLSFRR